MALATCSGDTPVSPGAGLQLSKVSGDAQYLLPGSASSPLVVRLRTSGGQSAGAGTAVTFGLNGPSGTTLSASSAVADDSGFARTVVHAGFAEGPIEVVVTAARNGVEVGGSPQQFGGAILNGIPAHLTALSPDSQSAIAGSLVTAPSVRVTDSLDRRLPRVPVLFQIQGCCGNLDSAGTAVEVLTDSSGIAAITTWRVAIYAGLPNVVRATVEFSALSHDFKVALRPGPPAVMEPRSFSSQIRPAGSRLLYPYSAFVGDQFGNPIKGVAVGWNTPDGGSLAPGSSLTDSMGRVDAYWTLGPAAGVQHATASVPGLDSISFVATATLGGAPITITLPSDTVVGVDHSTTVRAHLSVPATTSSTAYLFIDSTEVLGAVPVYPVTLGDTAIDLQLTGRRPGPATVYLDLAGYAEATFRFSVENRRAILPDTVTIAIGDTLTIPVHLPNPARHGGATFTITSDTAVVAVSAASITIPEGSQDTSFWITRIQAGVPTSVGVVGTNYGGDNILVQ